MFAGSLTPETLQFLSMPSTEMKKQKNMNLARKNKNKKAPKYLACYQITRGKKKKENAKHNVFNNFDWAGNS